MPAADIAAMHFASTGQSMDALIERYRGGMPRILAACAEAGLPAPVPEEAQGGFRMVFKQSERAAPATDQVTPQVTPQVQRLLHVLHGDCSREALMGLVGLKDREHFRSACLAPALTAGLVEMTLPNKPNSRLQRYRLTAKGSTVLEGRRA